MKRRKEVVGSAVAKGARLGGGEAVPARGRTLRARQERWAAGEGDRDAAQADGSLVAQASRDAQELAQARPVTVTYRRRQKRSRPGVRVCEDSIAHKGSGGHTRDLLFSGRQGQAESYPTARRRTLRTRQERGAAGEGDRDAAQADGPLAAQTSRHAQELAQTRPVTVAYRRRQKRSRPGVRVREDSDAHKGSGGHTRDLLFSGRQGQAESFPTARRPLSAAQ